jgi:hypothetical protein
MPVGKCALCQKTKNLRRSHLLPASLYRKTRSPGQPNPNPMVITNKISVQSSAQIAEFLLCTDCEQLLSKNGEAYVMTQVSDGKKFPLLDYLQTKAGTKRGEFMVYTEPDTPTIDRDRLTYFGLSVFWRASVRVWKQRGGKPITIDLGNFYNESLRKFLLGQTPFPSDVTLTVFVCTDTLTQESFFAPNLGYRGEYRTYNFAAKGLLFFMSLGKLIPAGIRRLCTMTGPGRPISTRDCQQKIAQGFLRLEEQQKKN